MVAVLPILTAGNPLLRQKTKKIKHVDDSLQRLIDDMIDTMRAAPGVGLAANQVGVPLRLAVIEIPPEAPEVEEESLSETPAPAVTEEVRGQLYILLNPEIVKREGERDVEEGCLSLPGYRGVVTRAERVVAKARDQHGKPIRIKAEGLLAQALEHETDHLDGVLYFDHMESLDNLHKIESEEEAEAEESPELVPVQRGGEAGSSG